MQNLASAFPQFAFASQTQQQEKATNESQQLPPELQFLLSASLEQGLYANQLAALKNATAAPTTSAAPATNGIPADFATLLLSSLTQQQPQQQQQNQSQEQLQQPTPTASASQQSVAAAAQQQQQQDDFAQLMALIAGPQQQQQQAASTAATNSFLEQMSFFTSPNFNNIASSQSQNSSMIPTTPTSSGSGSHFFGGINASMNSPSKDKDSYCEFCEKNFCNRYFLRIHKQKKHGIAMVDTAATSGNDTPPAKQAKLEQSVSPVKQQQNSGAASSVVTEEGEQQQPKQKESVDGMPPNIEAMLAAFQEAQSNKAAQSSQPDLLSLIQQLAKVKSPEPQQQQQEKFNCDKCSQDFSNQSLLLQHQLTQHTVMPSTTPPTSTSSQQQQQNNILNMLPAGFPALPFMLPQLSSNFPTLDMEFGNANSNHPSLNQSSLSKQSAPKRQYSSTTKNYCDLCNKEVCNKYFLRTHMLKMHNIVIDENKTVIANIDTQEKEKEGSVSFRCDVCHLDMKTRTQLKDHKKNVHGIQPVVAPSSASSQISNSSGSKPSSGSAFEFPPTSPSQTTSSTDFKCIRCERDYDSFQSLVGHLHDQHENEVTESEIMELLAKAASTSAAAFQEQQQQQSSQLEEGEIRDENDKTEGEEDEHDDEAMEITREVAMKMVVENQLKIKDDEEMPEIERGESDAQYICNSCGRHYSTQQNLNDHISTVHQYKIRLSPKKESRLILSPSKVNKIIKCFTCAKCNQRFAQSDLCKLHIIQHLRREQKDAESKENENLNGESSSTNVVEEQQHKEVFEDELISSFMREETTTRDKSGTMIEHVVSELSRRGSHGGLAKLPEEKHSHTSGSASPMSVHTMPEAYAQPMPVSSSTDPKPFVLQSFVMREVSNSNAFPTELHAYLPVRNLIDGPIRVTFELQAAPQIDAQIKNL